MKKLRRCKSCKAYTLQAACSICGSPTSSPHPPRFSPEDKFGRYRRKLKEARRAAS